MPRWLFPRWNPLLKAHSGEEQLPFTYQRGSYGGGGQGVRDDDEEDRVAQQQSDLEGDPLSAVWRQVETNNVHHHQEDAGQQQVHGVEQRPPPDHHLEERGQNDSWERKVRFGLLAAAQWATQTNCVVQSIV